ncbi:hypothetical protein ACHAXS_000641 [Conticribra weissflogii]
MNLYGSALSFPLLTADHGALEELRCWWRWEGNCAKCFTKVKPMQGIFCANFCASRGGWPACRQAWHKACYTCLGVGLFLMIEIKDEIGNVWHKQSARVERLNQGVKGVNTCMPFQCEVCWLRNLESRDPTSRDASYVMCIRRANLDAMAGKAKLTILSHLRETKTVIANCERIRKTPPFPPRGPFPLQDLVGMGVAVDMMQRSLTGKGRIGKFIQFDTMRKVRATYSKSWDSSPDGVAEGSSFSKGTGKVRMTSCPTQSEWFADFLRGAEYRMGYETRSNKAVPIGAIAAVLELIAQDALEGSEVEANQLYKAGAFIAILTAGSLRGYEGFFTDLGGIRYHLDKGREGTMPKDPFKRIMSEQEAAQLPHVTLCLLGDFKGESGTNYHMIGLANETKSGIKTRWWIEQLVDVAQREGRLQGPAFATPSGELENSGDYDAVFRQYLKQVQILYPTILSSDEDVDQSYGISRTPRKTAENRARRAGLTGDVQDAMNRWRTVENSKGKRPRFNMKDHYSNALLLMPVTWRYSYAQ